MILVDIIYIQQEPELQPSTTTTTTTINHKNEQEKETVNRQQASINSQQSTVSRQQSAVNRQPPPVFLPARSGFPHPKAENGHVRRAGAEERLAQAG